MKSNDLWPPNNYRKWPVSSPRRLLIFYFTPNFKSQPRLKFTKKNGVVQWLEPR